MTAQGGKPLRLWPGVVIGILTIAVRFGLPVVAPEASAYGLLGGVVGGLAVLAWWLFLSRAPWPDRLGGAVLMPLALFVTSRLVHESIATGAQGMLLTILAPPGLGAAFVVWAVTTRHLSVGLRRTTMVATILLACGVWAFVRTGGVTGSYSSDLHWRWTKTPEERLLAQSSDGRTAMEPPGLREAPESSRPPDKPVDERPAGKIIDKPVIPPYAAVGVVPATAGEGADWPGFRGPRRNDIIPGVRIKTDWTLSPPVALWRRPVGPGWSSFAARGGLLYTQEQRGSDELVSCYRLSNGEPVWTHRDKARFYESNGGPGPRATPALGNGRVYTLGATGILNALDAAGGAVVWTHNASSDAGTKVPLWGFASSPLVVDDVVVAYAGALVAYDLTTGDRRWAGPDRGVSYSSPQLSTISGVAQILMLSEAGANGVAPSDGKQLWQHPWGSSIVQPAATADGNLLIGGLGNAGGIGTRRIAVALGSGGWTVVERWNSTGLKPYFNDFVVHKGHVYGFDGSILACIDLEDGSREWKGGRYGNGQMILLPDQDLLLVLSEEGEMALVQATPEKFTELARFQAIEGKTWNHPVLVGDILLVRNGQEMAAFRLSLAGR